MSDNPDAGKQLLQDLSRLREMKLDDECPLCKKTELVKEYVLFAGPWSGRVICKTDNCEYRETLMSHIGKKILVVEPMGDKDAKS